MKLISAFVFATQIEHSLFFLNPNFQVHALIQKIFSRGGGPNSQKGSDGKFQENFNKAKINNLAIPGGGGGGVGGPDPLSPHSG